MRRLCSALTSTLAAGLAAALLITAPKPAAADLPDISGLTFDELVELREQLNLAIWQSADWQEVTVPAGTWTIGEDIPAGHWTLTPMDNRICYVVHASALDDTGKKAKRSDTIFSCTLISSTHAQKNDGLNQIDLDLTDGTFLILDAAVTVTPYAGKPDLGFK